MPKFIVASVALVLTACSTPSPQVAVQPGLPAMNCPKAPADLAPVPLWSTAGFSAPESVVYDAGSKTYFVSNVAGAPDGKDGKGWISKVGLSGKISRPQWVRGLHAPKGMRLNGPFLWVTDIDRVIVFDIRTGQRVQTYTVEGAKFLNDIEVAGALCMAISDMATGKIHTICKGDSKYDKNGTVRGAAVEGAQLEHPNGLVALDTGKFLIAGWGPGMKGDFSTDRPGRILEMDLPAKHVKPWNEATLGNLDGIEVDDKGGVFVSDWMAGKVFHVSKEGRCHTILEGLKNTADIGYVSATRTLLVPVMGEDRVAAFRIPTSLQ